MNRPTNAARNYETYIVPRTPVPVNDSRASTIYIPPAPIAPTIDRSQPRNDSPTQPFGKPRRARRTQQQVLESLPEGADEAIYALQRISALERRVNEIINSIADSSLETLLKLRPDLGRFRHHGE